MNQWLNAHTSSVIKLAEYIFSHPETAYQEVLSSQCLIHFLESEGFAITAPVANIDTAFCATWGEGSPVLGFLAEYDALPELGHACGHNLLGSGVVGAACDLKDRMIRENLKGTIKVFGCPAEEILSGKIKMKDAGVFNDIDTAITWHPFDRNRISNDIWQSQDIKNYTFHGISAHASKNPDKGRSALDAAELMNIGVNYLREHVPTDVRMHYAYLDNRIPANVVPDYAKTNYFIRSSKRALTEEVSKRVDACAQGAALMTGTTVDIELVSYCKEMKLNSTLNHLFFEVMKELEVPSYTEAELSFAAKISEEINPNASSPLFTGLEPLEDSPVPISIGTDVSEISHDIPTITISAATMCKGTPLHHPAAAAQAGMSIGHKGMIYAAKIMSNGAYKLIQNPEIIHEAKKEI